VPARFINVGSEPLGPKSKWRAEGLENMRLQPFEIHKILIDAEATLIDNRITR